MNLEIEKLKAEIAKTNAETEKINQQAKWFPVVVTTIIFLVAIVLVKVFLS